MGEKLKKKYRVLVIVIFVILIFAVEIYANDSIERMEVQLVRAIDGDAADFRLNDRTIRVRFLGIDTPEMGFGDRPAEEWALEATEYTRNALERANKIEIAYDENREETDVWERYLVWVWVDNELLQERLLLAGLAETAFIEDNYRFVDILQEAESIARQNEIGIWSEEIENNDRYVIGITIGAIVLALLSIIVRRIKHNNKK